MSVNEQPFTPADVDTDRDDARSRGQLQPPIDALNQLTTQGLLRDQNARLERLEAPLDRKAAGRGHLGESLDLIKALLGSWATFAFVFLLLFHKPVYDLLTVLPDKVRSASEIGLGGVTLKSAVQRVATSQGVAGLGKSIP